MNQAVQWRYVIELSADAVSVSTARRFTADRLAEHDLLSLVDDVVLVVSELVTNAVIHARSAPTLTLRGDDRAVLVSVLDGSSTVPLALTPQPRDPSGRGLSIVTTLSDAWGTDLVASGSAKSIWASFGPGQVLGYEDPGTQAGIPAAGPVHLTPAPIPTL